MNATVVHRDRAVRAETFYRTVTTVSSAPNSVEKLARRSIRHAAKSQLRDALQEYYDDLEEL